jgi:integrase/recombinase XerD
MKIKRLTKEDVEAFRRKVLQFQRCDVKRDYAIVTVMAYAGLRVPEVVEVKKTDIDFENRQMVVVSEKYKNQRTIVINRKIISAVEAYIAEDDVKSEYLFHDQNGDKLKLDGINHMFKEYCDGSDLVHPTMLRDFFCNRAMDCAYSQDEVNEQMGIVSGTSKTDLEKIKEKAENL